MRKEIDEKDWDKKVIAAGGSFLQSSEWGGVQENLGRKVKYLESDDVLSLIVEHKLPFDKCYLYSPRGPLTPHISPESWHIFLEEVRAKALENKPIFVRVEPTGRNIDSLAEGLTKAGFRRTEPVQPKATLILDLNKSEEELLGGMEHDTRYSIRAAEKRGVKVINLADASGKEKAFNEFWSLFLATNKRHGLKMYPRGYYQEVLKLNGNLYSELYFATLEDKIISAAVVVFFGKTANYLYAASLPGYGKFNAPTLVVWKAAFEAKKRGCKIFDFWGISDENKAWQGVTAFKRSFGGGEINYSGTWDFIFDKKWHFLHNLAKKII